MSVWILVIVLFVADGSVETAVLQGEDGADAEKCEATKKIFDARAKSLGHTFWGMCVEVPKPKVVLPPPKPMDGDGPSPDGKRRGQSA